MDVDFRNNNLVELYETGRNKKYKLQPNILRKFFMRIQELEAAKDIHDLWKKPSLNFERLQGFKNRYSLRLQDKWRLEIEIEWENEEQTEGTVYIVELSSHYGR